MKATTSILIVGLSLAGQCQAVDLVVDGFETYPVTQMFVTPLNGWQATDGSVQVQDRVVIEGTRALGVASGAQLSNTVSAADGIRIWTDQWVHPSLGEAPETSPAEGESLHVYFTGNGYVAVYHNGVWDVCTNDVNGVVVPPVSGGWVRVSFLTDYAVSNAAVLLDGRVLRDQLPFAGASASAYQRLRYVNDNDVSNGFVSNSFVDAVFVSTNFPVGLGAGVDGDNDGMEDTAELHAYGNTTSYHRPVITVTNVTVGIDSQDSGSTVPSGTFDVFPGSDTNFTIAANAAFLVSDITTNGMSVGSFAGRNTRNAVWNYVGITVDTLVQVEFTYTAVRFVPSDYATLGAAVSAALSNETIVVGSGSYAVAAPIVITRPLHLLGDTNTPANTVLMAPTAGVDRDIFQVRANNVTIRGFRMTGAVNGTAPAPGWINAAVMVGNDAGNARMASPSTIEGLTNCVLACNEYANCTHAVYLHEGVACFGHLSALSSDNTTGVWSSVTTDWSSNWWGAANGPSGTGPGDGVPVSENVLYDPWWTDSAGTHFGHQVDESETLQSVFDQAASGDTIFVPTGTYPGDLTVDVSVRLLGGDFTVGGHLTFLAGATLVGAGTLIADDLIVAAGQATSFIGGSLTITELVVGSGGSLEVVGGTLVVGDTTLSGTFTLDDTWGTGLVPHALPFEDCFEFYTPGQRLDRLGIFGWSASAPSVVVQTTKVKEGAKALVLPSGTELTNGIRTVTSETNIWTDLYVLPSLGIAPEEPPGSGESLHLYFTTNGYVAVATNGGWDICATDAAGVAVPGVGTDWVRVSLHHDFARKRVAVFLDGRLLREAIPFLHADVTDYHRLCCRTGQSKDNPTAYIDAVAITTDLPGGLELVTQGTDGDNDDMSDASEIHLYGNLTTYDVPKGSLFQFR